MGPPISSVPDGSAPSVGGTSSSSPAPRQRPQSASDQQALALQRLLKDPTRPVHIPKPPKEKELRAPREMMKNVSGSSAGAGSGEFHVYKHARRREYERIKLMEEKEQKAKEAAAFEAQQAALEASSSAKTDKNRAKRDKKKARAAAAAAAAAASAAPGGAAEGQNPTAEGVESQAASREGEGHEKKRRDEADGTEEVAERKKRRIARPAQGVSVSFRKPGAESEVEEQELEKEREE